MVLESPFCSVASFSWKYGFPPFLVKNPFHTDHVLAQLEAPVVILHGRADDIVPIHHSRALVKLARNATLTELDTGHNDDALASDPSAWNAIDTALRTINALSTTP